MPPTATVTPSNAHFQVGDTKQLTCTATGYPEPKIKWSRNGQIMTSGVNSRVIGDVLELRNMGRPDEGVYTCFAENPAGHHTANATLNYMGKNNMLMVMMVFLELVLMVFLELVLLMVMVMVMMVFLELVMMVFLELVLVLLVMVMMMVFLELVLMVFLELVLLVMVMMMVFLELVL